MSGTIYVLRHITALALGLFFIKIGVDHFLDPVWFEPIVPTVLGHPRFWVYASGVVEIALGIGLIIPFTRRKAGGLLAIFLVLLYWANVNMWINDIEIGGVRLSTGGHIARAFAQLAMIGMALWVGRWFFDPKAKV